MPHPLASLPLVGWLPLLLQCGSSSFWIWRGLISPSFPVELLWCCTSCCKWCRWQFSFLLHSRSRSHFCWCTYDPPPSQRSKENSLWIKQDELYGSVIPTNKIKTKMRLKHWYQRIWYILFNSKRHKEKERSKGGSGRQRPVILPFSFSSTLLHRFCLPFYGPEARLLTIHLAHSFQVFKRDFGKQT